VFPIALIFSGVFLDYSQFPCRPYVKREKVTKLINCYMFSTFTPAYLGFGRNVAEVATAITGLEVRANLFLQSPSETLILPLTYTQRGSLGPIRAVVPQEEISVQNLVTI
jgi:hypothetical protein